MSFAKTPEQAKALDDAKFEADFETAKAICLAGSRLSNAASFEAERAGLDANPETESLVIAAAYEHHALALYRTLVAKGETEIATETWQAMNETRDKAAQLFQLLTRVEVQPGAWK